MWVQLVQIQQKQEFQTDCTEPKILNLDRLKFKFYPISILSMELELHTDSGHALTYDITKAFQLHLFVLIPWLGDLVQAVKDFNS